MDKSNSSTTARSSISIVRMQTATQQNALRLQVSVDDVSGDAIDWVLQRAHTAAPSAVSIGAVAAGGGAAATGAAYRVGAAP